VAGAPPQTPNDSGLGFGLGDTTAPLTDPVDQTLQGNAPGVSDPVGQLGRAVSGTVDGGR
jgi:hypothetical protein